MQEALTRLGSRLTYGEAQEELELLWGIKVSKTSVRQTTMRYGKMAQQLVDERVRELHQGQASEEAQKAPERLVMCTDGALIQTTSGEWKEVKTMTIGEFERVWDPQKQAIKTKTEQISYFSRLEEAAKFEESAIYEWDQRGGAVAQEVVAVNDGALWIQAFIDYHCPQATRVIDFAHAQSYVAKVGKLIYGAQSEAFQQWYPQMSKQLYTLPPQRTLNELRFLRHTHPDHPQFAELDQAIRYLEKRQDLIDYPHFRQKGIPIGSGIVEAGHRVVCQRRMKQAGMRWGEENINPMLTLRNALCNQRWAQTWRDVQRYALSSTKSPPCAPPILAVAQDRVGENEIAHLAKLVDTLTPPHKNQPWSDHRFIFPHRYH